MRRSLSGGVIAVLLCTAAAADDERDCRDHKDPELRIKSCSTLLERDSKNAASYYNRGTAFQSKGDLDRAIADYSKATELKPTYAAAYESRGRAYASKGDYVHALADVTRASELLPRKAPAQAAGPDASRPQAGKSTPRKPKPLAIAVRPAKNTVAKEAIENSTNPTPIAGDSHL